MPANTNAIGSTMRRSLDFCLPFCLCAADFAGVWDAVDSVDSVAVVSIKLVWVALVWLIWLF